MCAWEIGRASTGLGTKVGGLGSVVEELPRELVKAAAAQGVELEIEILSPCFAHYDRSRLRKLDIQLPVECGGHAFSYEAYEHVFDDGQRAIYFWDDFQLSWTSASHIYPSDPQFAIARYATVSQAMAGYIRQRGFDTVHLHDYHVGLVPFYLDLDSPNPVPAHLTIHNATYQGETELIGGGYSSLDRIALPGWKVFHQYFDHNNRLNLMKACMIRVNEIGGKITTVSGDLAASWGYAAELRENYASIWSRAYAQKGSAPVSVFVPNGGLDVFERIPVAGITNGLSARDHAFDNGALDAKDELKRKLHLAAFGAEPVWDPIVLTVVGRLVEQKNLGLVADVIDRVFSYDPGVKLAVMASPGDQAGRADQQRFADAAKRHPGRICFNPGFDHPLSRLILAGGDFCLIPSRFEPCGLVDYEASIVGNIVIGRATGGLVKVRHCAYLYEWLDIGDRAGELTAFWWAIKAAIDTYRHGRKYHQQMMRTAMAIDSSWDSAARDYVEMYRYGLAARKWREVRREFADSFREKLGDDARLFGGAIDRLLV